MDDYEIKSIEAALEKREETVFDWGIWRVSCRLTFVREHGRLARVACCLKHPKWSYSEYEYSRNLPHHQRAFEPLFVSFSTRNNWALPGRAKDIVLEACKFHDGKLITLHALVVMSTHVHVLCSMRFDQKMRLIPLRKLTHSIKSFTAHEINKILGLEGRVWEEESFDRGVRSESDFNARLLYIRMNPIRAGLVKKAEDYKWFWQDLALKPPSYKFKATSRD
jgi:REP element-mobilizing transposase RayT